MPQRFYSESLKRVGPNEGQRQSFVSSYTPKLNLNHASVCKVEPTKMYSAMDGFKVDNA